VLRPLKAIRKLFQCTRPHEMGAFVIEDDSNQEIGNISSNQENLGQESFIHESLSKQGWASVEAMRPHIGMRMNRLLSQLDDYASPKSDCVDDDSLLTDPSFTGGVDTSGQESYSNDWLTQFMHQIKSEKGQEMFNSFYQDLGFLQDGSTHHAYLERKKQFFDPRQRAQQTLEL
jgi:hypothetical protein